MCLISSLFAAAALTAGDVELKFDDAGCVTSLRLGDRELVGERVPFAVATVGGRERPLEMCARSDGRIVAGGMSGGREIRPERCELRDGRIVLAFPGGGEAAFRVEPSGWGFRFTHETLTVEGATGFAFGCLRPSCRKYVGAFANAWSDDGAAVVLRAYDEAAEMRSKEDLSLATGTAHGLVGTRFALVVGSRADIFGRLQAMTRDFCAVTGVPLPVNGGAFSQGADAVRGSYFMVTPRMDLMDDAIDLANRSGAAILHFKNWWDTIGHYRANPSLFPKGEADFLVAAEMIRKAGLVSSMHSLSAGIGIDDDWVRDGHVAQLKPFAGFGYTLAAPLGADAKELTVNEPIRDGHHRTLTYLGNGNVLRIDGELIQYSDFDRSRRAFTGLVRGALGTVAAAHAAGARTDYVQHRYREFYPVAGSPLVGEIAASLANRFRDGGFVQFYCDGAEGQMDRYEEDTALREIYCRLAAVRPPVIEASAYGPHNWWWHSRVGTWDTPIWRMKRYHDLHLGELARMRKADFLAVGTGWFYPKTSNEQGSGFFRDDIEYFAAKNAGCDYPNSVGVGGPFFGRDIAAGMTDAFTIIGWYERLRMSRAFAPGVPGRLAEGWGEWRLRQNAEGVWTVRPARVIGTTASMAENLAGGEPLALRVEALWSADESAAGRTLVESVGPVTAAKPFVKTWEYPYGSVVAGGDVTKKEGRPAWRFRVKGDGRGGVLRLRLVSPREFGAADAEHRVKIDFTGWRTVTLFDRERDGETDDPMLRYRVYRNSIAPDHISEVSFALEGEGAVEVDSLKALPVRRTTDAGLSVAVNGTEIRVPFALASDEYAELEDGLWRRYDGTGLVIGEAEGPRPAVVVGENRFALSGGSRAKLTVQALGKEEPAVAGTLTAEQRKALAHEYDLTRVWNPKAGVTHLDPVVIRPGEKARLQVRYVGSSVDPVLTVGGVKLSEGISEQSFTGSNDVRFSCASSGPVRIEIAKIYH